MAKRRKIKAAKKKNATRNAARSACDMATRATAIAAENIGARMAALEMPIPPIPIALFEASEEEIARFTRRFDGEPVDIVVFRSLRLGPEIQNALVEFRPHLIVVDPVFSQDDEDGERLVKGISNDNALKNIPIVACSKYINDVTEDGRLEKKRCGRLPGVVATFGNVPDYPPARVFLYYARVS